MCYYYSLLIKKGKPQIVLKLLKKIIYVQKIKRLYFDNNGNTKLIDDGMLPI